MEPTLDVVLQLPEASASATAQLRRSAVRASLASPSGDAAGTLHLAPPSFEAVKAALTQAEATALARPNVTGLDADVSLRGLDVVPLVGDEQALRHMTAQAGQPLRLRLNGRARVSGTVSQAGGQAGEAGAPGWLFAGDLGLESVRVNQLKLWQKLAGRLSVSGAGVSVHGKGLRAHETLDLDLALPLLAQQQPEAQQQVQQVQQVQQAQQEQQAEAAAGEAEQAAPVEPQPGAGDAAEGGAEEGEPSAAATLPEPAAAAAAQPPATQQRGGGGLQLRCGPLQVAAEVDAAGSQLDFKVRPRLRLGLAGRAGQGPACAVRHGTPASMSRRTHCRRPPAPHQVAALKLDELELASLRGDLQVGGCRPSWAAQRCWPGGGGQAAASPLTHRPPLSRAACRRSAAA